MDRTIAVAGSGARGTPAIRRLARLLIDALPTGQTLPDSEWASRHRAMVWILWAHVVGLPVFLLAQGFGLWGSFRPILPLLVAAGVASSRQAGRRGRSVAVALGLLTASAVLVYGWHGQIEAHFHFFVMIVLLSLYEDWLPFGLAIGYVALEHGILGALAPHDVYSHGGNPWFWAAVHGGFVLAASAACVAAWRLNENTRARMVEAHDAARNTSRRFEAAFDSGISGMALQSTSGHYLQVNEAFCSMLGYTEAELVGLSFTALTHPDDRGRSVEPMRAMLDGRIELTTAEKRYLHRDGTAVWVQAGIRAVRDREGEVEYFIVQYNDITERKRYEAKLAHGALHDPLTGLPNRILFVERLGHALQRLRRHHEPLAVLFIDLDRFKLVNDSLGHAAGDAVLSEAAARLRTAVREDDTVARFGGDEFTVLCEGADEAEARQVAARLLGVLDAPFRQGKTDFNLSASVGVRLSDRGDVGADELVRDADIALYSAKARGRGRCVVFDGKTPTGEANSLSIERELRLAIDAGQLELHYQPEVELATGRLIAAEALVRWRHPQRGLVPPDEFIPLAEQSDLILRLGSWVLREACRQLAEWRRDGVVGTDFRVAVNISARQLSRAGLAAELAVLLGEYGLSARSLCLEITEGVLMDDAQAARGSLEAIKRLGANIALDDFGVGFSSLSRIRDLPVFDVVKIDRSFTAGVAAAGPDAAVIAAALSLAQRLGATAVAEGIETPAQLDALRELGCDIGQGFLLGRPLPAEEVRALLELGSKRAVPSV
jgi:diguanylate cyclase (GGDEF)-like protein/PAS domain S-box-containing protein